MAGKTCWSLTRILYQILISYMAIYGVNTGDIVPKKSSTTESLGGIDNVGLSYEIP